MPREHDSDHLGFCLILYDKCASSVNICAAGGLGWS